MSDEIYDKYPAANFDKSEVAAAAEALDVALARLLAAKEAGDETAVKLFKYDVRAARQKYREVVRGGQTSIGGDAYIMEAGNE